MSVESIASLNSEITQLKKQVEDAVNQANGFVAQLDAHKQMLSEVIGNYLNTKAGMIMSNRHLHEANAKLSASEKQVESLNQQLTDATAKILELTHKDNVKEIPHAANKIAK